MEDRTRELITEFIKENALNQFLFLPVVLAKLFRRTIFFLLKDTIKIRQVIESALITDFCDRHRRIYQQPRSKTQPDINDIVGKVFPRAQFKEAAERHISHSDHTSQLPQSNFFLIVKIDILLHLLYTTTIGMDINLSKRRTG